MTATLMGTERRAWCWASHAKLALLSLDVGRNLMVLLTVLRPSIVPSSSDSVTESERKNRKHFSKFYLKSTTLKLSLVSGKNSHFFLNVKMI